MPAVANKAIIDKIKNAFSPKATEATSANGALLVLSLSQPKTLIAGDNEIIFRCKGLPNDYSVIGFERSNGSSSFSFKVTTNAGELNQAIGVYTFQNTKYVFVVGTFDNGSCHFYVNGEFIDSRNFNGDALYPENESTVGAYRGDGLHSFEGNIALTRVYNKILSAEDVNVLYKFIHKKYGVLEGFND